MSKVYLVGAGPGDIELLTVKALKLVQNADIIIYDRLANKGILDEANSDCKFIDVGKSSGKHPVKQEKINELLYDATKNYKSIVRLKGGDPFIFGRGAEEALYLKEKGVKFEIVPGVSSISAVPSYAGIPITYRKFTSSFRVVTGHESKKSQSFLNWDSFKEDETIIFLMGLHNINKIVTNLIRIGKSENYPIAVISKGTTKEQKVVVGTLVDIEEKVKDLETPSLIIIGEVVNLRDDLKWFLYDN